MVDGVSELQIELYKIYVRHILILCGVGIGMGGYFAACKSP